MTEPKIVRGTMGTAAWLDERDRIVKQAQRTHDEALAALVWRIVRLLAWPLVIAFEAAFVQREFARARAELARMPDGELARMGVDRRDLEEAAMRWVLLGRMPSPEDDASQSAEVESPAPEPHRLAA
jgi:uncharacterized protein YjiS (DUF1127 family)